MKDAFDAAANTEPPTASLSDFDLAMTILDEMEPNQPKPDFVTVVPWSAFEDADFILFHDRVNHARALDNDPRRVFGFHKDEYGEHALSLLYRGFPSLQIWESQGDGRYCSFDPENLYRLDFSEAIRMIAAYSSLRA